MRTDYLKVLLATVLFGSFLVASKLIVREVPVFVATFVRLASAAVILGIYVRSRGIRLPRLSKRDVLVLVVQATLGMLAFSVCAMYGVEYTGAIEAGVVLSMVPVGMSIVALVFLRERMSMPRFAGIAISVCGVAGINVLSSRAGAAHEAGHAVLGAVLLFGAVGCEVVFLMFARLLSTPVSPAVLSLLLSVIGAALVAVPAAQELRHMPLGAVSLHSWALMIYTGVAINGVAVVLMYDSLNRIETTVVSAFTALTPVSGTVLSVLFAGETFHMQHLGGIAMVVAGVFIVAQDAAVKSSRRPVSEGLSRHRSEAATLLRVGECSGLQGVEQ
jgi:drug/metabolite transporter (DMT)-like permease